MTVNNIHPLTPHLQPAPYPHHPLTPTTKCIKCYIHGYQMLPQTLPHHTPPTTPTYILPTSYTTPTQLLPRSINEAYLKHPRSIKPQLPHPKTPHNTLTTTPLQTPTIPKNPPPPPHKNTPWHHPSTMPGPNTNPPDAYLTTGLPFTTHAPAAADAGARNNAT